MHNNMHMHRKKIHTHAHRYICTEYNNNMQHIEQNREYNNNNMQHIQDNTETEHTIQNTDTLAQSQHRCSTYDLHTYSFDLYHEQIAIKNSNTIELYTISKENI